ncbi:MAG: 2-polyprenyl-6-methoxyphenol hydroxylase-like oxidoreductase [Amycolatopsis sp.]|uniref:FAD-dependent monooxygenase n=1 Tax=Amycolatopsis sp. TaxID=37632 RepID=UPI002622B9AF|nr:FAD-dependent monooxygenase [Amycolatopsis sp.]MCU1679312.1 2-polyprenyl-6-methoxyphenol hydroxylase-like oxidoreductase [Amycolatopsis sp.]
MTVPDLPAVDVEVEVLIVGGGPVGLTARVLLERWGVRTLLVEKYGKLSPFPRSRLVNTRTMEIYRQVGLAARITDRAFAPEYGRVRFRDTLQDRDFATAAMIGINAPIPESPVTGVLSSQDRLEPTLLAAADTPVRYGVELIDLAEEPEGVVAVLVDHQSGEETRVRARYVLAADGANSTVRQRLGIDTIGPGSLADATTVVFDADLDRWCGDQPAGVYFTAHGMFGPLYPERGWAFFVPTPEDTANADWPDLVSRALGSDIDVHVDVERVQHWTVNASVAERFRHGRILLAGDAAHAIPPAGGLGMNTGVADVHNLCWKLAGVLRGWAGQGLVETYEPERLPVAHQTLRQAVANSHLMRQAQDKRREQLQNDDSTSAQVEVPWSERYFAQLDLVLGTTYHSDAVLIDDSTPPELSDTGTDYVPTARPGHRMPHLWLAENRSTVDAVGEWFTLFTPDPAFWEKQKAAPWPLHVEALSSEHTDVCDLGPQGALLVRPDGHISARWRDWPPSDSALHDALTATTR